MSTQAVQYDKLNEFRREFTELPNVLLQDPARGCSYFVDASELKKYEASIDTWAKVDDSTVTFVIPDNELIDEVPPFLRNPELHPSVLIRYAKKQTSYFLSFDDLQKFKAPLPQVTGDGAWVSFIIPRGTELIEELPSMRRALLQSGTQ